MVAFLCAAINGAVFILLYPAIIETGDAMTLVRGYIEMNPIKASMVKDIADYEWSSYRHNALNQTDSLITEHKLYKDLGTSAKQRCESYREMFDALNITKQESQITEATIRDGIYGSSIFQSKSKWVNFKTN